MGRASQEQYIRDSMGREPLGLNDPFTGVA